MAYKNTKKLNSSIIIYSFAEDMDGTLSLRRRTFKERPGKFDALIEMVVNKNKSTEIS